METGILLATAIGLSALMAAQAGAVTCGNVSFTLTQDGTNLTGVCGTSVNDFPADLNALSPDGINTWLRADKSDNNDGNQEATFADPVPAQGQSPRTWAVNNPNNYPSLLLTLKQATKYAYFVLDLTKSLNGTWGTSGPGGSTNGLSHSTLFVAGTPAPVPLPAAGLLLAGALGGFAALRRRKARA